MMEHVRSGDWLDRERFTGYCFILLALELVVLLFMIAGTHGLIVPLDHPTTTDFVSFYGAGVLANHGHGALAYDQAAHYAVEQQIRGQGIPYQFFFYPPVFLLLCSVLARLPYLVAFVVFETATLGLFLLIGYLIDGKRRLGVILPLAAFPCVFWTFGLGQNAFLTAALFGAATLLVDRKPTVAGILFGALCYKPHLGLLIPVALAASGRWRTFTTAAASVSALVLLSAWLFGWGSWRAFFIAAGQSHGTYEAGRIDFAGFVSPFGAIRLLGGSPEVAYILQATATLAAAAFVAFVWRQRVGLAMRSAVLAAATLVAAPVLLIYDLMLGAVAALWLVQDARETGWLPWERTALAALFVTPLFARNIAGATHIPVLPLADLALAAIVAARACHELAQRTPEDATRAIVSSDASNGLASRV
jgi:alpha-1,2-mannosyltransferase